MLRVAGEITMWFAMALAATAAGFSSVGSTAAWAFASPAFTALLLLKVMWNWMPE